MDKTDEPVVVAWRVASPSPPGGYIIFQQRPEYFYENHPERVEELIVKKTKYDSPIALGHPLPIKYNEEDWVTRTRKHFDALWAIKHPSGYDDNYEECWKYYLAGYEQHCDESQP